MRVSITKTHVLPCECGHVASVHDEHGCVALIFGHENASPRDCPCMGYAAATESRELKSA